MRNIPAALYLMMICDARGDRLYDRMAGGGCRGTSERLADRRASDPPVERMTRGLRKEVESGIMAVGRG